MKVQGTKWGECIKGVPREGYAGTLEQVGYLPSKVQVQWEEGGRRWVCSIFVSEEYLGYGCSFGEAL